MAPGSVCKGPKQVEGGSCPGEPALRGRWTGGPLPFTIGFISSTCSGSAATRVPDSTLVLSGVSRWLAVGKSDLSVLMEGFCHVD